MVVDHEGVSLIGAGLDHWFDKPSDASHVDESEFQFGEWRLERLLEVDHFRLPPDNRTRREFASGDTVNLELKIPFLRFPQWHVCPMCGRLERATLTRREPLRCVPCAAKSHGDKKGPRLVQARFIAMCEDGHIQDFPWREWAHASITPSCSRPMKLLSTGGASLSATTVTCECGVRRTLDRITNTVTQEAAPDANAEDDDQGVSTVLTDELERGNRYSCRGGRPWLGEEASEWQICERPLRGSLRGATNVYYAHVRSAIFLPRGSDVAPPELVNLLSEPRFRSLIKLFIDLERRPDAASLRQQQGRSLAPYTDAQIEAALRILDSSPDELDGMREGDDEETAFRRAEYASLRVDRAEGELHTSRVGLDCYETDFATFFTGITLVQRLRETRALAGFSRVVPQDRLGLAAHKAMLWRDPPADVSGWLPAYVVHGEGIFLELDEQQLRRWENRSDVLQRIAPLLQNYRRGQAGRRLEGRAVSPRLILLHSLAHALINQLTFECGYSSASIRERLYVSESLTAPMAGILIYTAAGDSEGTMGGLVRMGKPGYLESVLWRALRNAEWCSADPVCMELGAKGQGPDSCNLAACHNCALVPETSCEQFNRFLDRALLTGTIGEGDMGYFTTRRKA